jgi:hypothetical protein
MLKNLKTPQKKTFLEKSIEEDLQLPPYGFLYQTQWFQIQMFFYPQDFHLRQIESPF